MTVTIVDSAGRLTPTAPTASVSPDSSVIITSSSPPSPTSTGATDHAPLVYVAGSYGSVSIGVIQ